MVFVFTLDDLVLAEDNALHVGHHVAVGNQVVQSVLGQVVLRQVQRNDAPQRKHYPWDHLVIQLVPDQLHRPHLRAAQKLTNLHNHAVPQLRVC